LLDAGSVTATLPLDSQAAIDHVLISHAHLNHVAALAFLADNLFAARTRPIEVWSIPPVIRQLKTHIFNGIIWPDFTTLPSPRNPILSLHEIREGQPQRIGEYEVVSVRVHHTVEAAGYLVSDGETSILFQGDSGPTDEFWKVANAAARLQAIIVETSFPNRLQDLANASGHLTPQTLHADLKKLKVNALIYAQHIKPQVLSEVVRELAELSYPPVTPLEQGKVYTFSTP
ncbi:MAG: MBL fold metallo-hydrolase, partial [Candidatus Methylomirabilis sp.]